MEKQLEQCKREDYQELLVFLNKAFAKDEEGWFVKHMGNIYEPIAQMSDERIGYNYIIKDKGQIIASIGIFPMPITSKLGKHDIQFTMAGIGSVAVDTAYRGHGIMSAMLHQVNAIMREQGYPLSWLQGNRYRYKNYGWDTAGSQYNLDIGLTELDKMKLQPLQGIEATIEDIPKLSTSYGHYENCQIRSHGLWESHLRRPSLKVITDGDSYLIYQKNQPQRIYELAGHADVLALLYGHMKEHNLTSVEVTCPRDYSRLSKTLVAVCSSYRITSVGCSYGRIQVVNPEKMWDYIKEPLEEELHRYCNESYIAETMDIPKIELIKEILGFVDYSREGFIPKLPIWVSEIDLV